MIGSLGYHWFLDIFDGGGSGTKNEFGIKSFLFQVVFFFKMMADMWIDLIIVASKNLHGFSMYGIVTYIYHKFKPNVGKYTCARV